jgi:predicted Ser/Thr protein kinase
MDLPERIGKYRITGMLGRGAMGVVYRGFDPDIQRPVAVKVVHRALLGDDEVHASIAARFRNEAQAVGRLQHPGIVAIYEFGEDEAAAYIAMEFVEGRNLEQVLAATPLPAETEARRILDELLAALTCAHRAGVLHRDVKPANLILAASGQVKLTDFGIARIRGLGLTQVASMIGTPGYMAPEQYLGEGIDERADLYAAGVLLYRLLTGALPFAGTPETVMYKTLNEPPPPPSQLRPRGQARAYDALIAKALAKAPDDRFASAQAFRDALLALHPATVDDGNDGDDATRIVAARLPVAAAGASSATASVAIDWDAATLARIERALATHLGPLARLLVRREAQRGSDLDRLVAALAEHIDAAPQREHFVGEALAAGSGTTGTTTAARAASGTTVASAVAPIDEVWQAHALAVLTRHIGPIARIVVKRAADQARNPEQFVEGLLAAVAESERPALAKALQRPA